MKKVIVVGSGLAGLVAALRMQRAGYYVEVFEKSDRFGGLCGTHVLDGYEFILACNDFGRGLVLEMENLDVPTRFYKTQTRFNFQHGSYSLPLGIQSALPLVRHLPGIARLIQGFSDGADYMSSLVEAAVRNSDTADLILSLAYPLGIHPNRFPLDLLRAQFAKEYAYGYEVPHIPAGGPAQLVAAMTDVFRGRGGILRNKIAYQGVVRDGNQRIIMTDCGEHRADCVISSSGRWKEYPAHFASSLEVNMLLLAVRCDFRYPANVHTIVSFPPGISQWMQQLEEGIQPERFGFHLFRNALPQKPDHYTINVFTLAPRHQGQLDQPTRDRIISSIIGGLEVMLPGIFDAILYKRLLTASEFRNLTGLSTTLVTRVPEAGFQKPPIYDPNHGIYYIGNSVYPPGEHAGAAVLSAKLATIAACEDMNR